MMGLGWTTALLKCASLPTAMTTTSEMTITVTAVLQEKTTYLCEVHQSGIFQIEGFPEAQRNAVINILCPNTLYPYARAQITQLVAAGGFPPVVLQPISFEQIYAQRMQQQQQQGAEAAQSA